MIRIMISAGMFFSSTNLAVARDVATQPLGLPQMLTVESAFVSDCFNKIDKWVSDLDSDNGRYFRELPIVPGWYNSEYASNLRKIALELSGKNKILWMNESAKAQLKMDEACSDRKCDKVTGLYFPDFDAILLDSSLMTADSDQSCPSLLHEVVHAYQYRWRFPLDFIALATEAGLFAKSGLFEQNEFGIKAEEIKDYLSFYYEAQASYYQLSLQRNADWKDISKWKTALWTATVYPDKFTQGIVSGIFAGVRSLVQTSKFVLPEQDQKMLKHYKILKNESASYPSNSRMIFSFSELIVQNGGVLLGQDGFFSIPGEWHAHLAKRLVEAYFGDLDFVFGNRAEDQRIFVTLHDNHRMALGHTEMADACPVMNRYLTQENSSPLRQWLSIDDKTLASCTNFQIVDNVSAENIRMFGSLPSGVVNKFKLRFMPESGRDGSPPGLSVQPNLLMRP